MHAAVAFILNPSPSDELNVLSLHVQQLAMSAAACTNQLCFHGSDNQAATCKPDRRASGSSQRLQALLCTSSPTSHGYNGRYAMAVLAEHTMSSL